MSQSPTALYFDAEPLRLLAAQFCEGVDHAPIAVAAAKFSRRRIELIETGRRQHAIELRSAIHRVAIYGGEPGHKHDEHGNLAEAVLGTLLATLLPGRLEDARPQIV
jgi:hypothetical protein